MIGFLRRVLVTALTPPHTRRPPVNAKREALHEALRRSINPQPPEPK